MAINWPVNDSFFITAETGPVLVLSWKVPVTSQHFWVRITFGAQLTPCQPPYFT
ncbi:MAG: hypothetical protein WCF90_06470 [Methanomicrobiales archaeon]